MIGLLINENEKNEIIYLLKREMDEILFDLEDERINIVVKTAMRDRYQTLFDLFKRMASQKECIQYMLPQERKNHL